MHSFSQTLDTPIPLVAGSDRMRSVMHPPILVVEDDVAHAALVERVLGHAGLANPVHAVKRGDEALAYLEGEGAGDGRPALVLLDVHLPGVAGLEVLARLRDRPETADLPVVMFSGSGDSVDINRAFELGANSYLVKPVAFDALLDTIRDLNLPWALCAPDGGHG
jgi:CheY-like chemotaxis protein